MHDSSDRSATAQSFAAHIDRNQSGNPLTRQRREDLLLGRGMEGHNLRYTGSVLANERRPEGREAGLPEEGRLARDGGHCG